METVEFEGWVLKVDRDATLAAYADMEIATPPGCGCPDCMRFGSVRRSLFPTSVLPLLMRIGVDLDKEAELSNFGPDENGRDNWWWFYHFVGAVVERPYEPRTKFVVPGTQVTPAFSLSFNRDVDLVSPSFPKRAPLAQLDCFHYDRVRSNVITST